MGKKIVDMMVTKTIITTRKFASLGKKNFLKQNVVNRDGSC